MSSSTEQHRENGSTSDENPGSNQEGNFECNICLDTAKDAVVSLCGHLFCWPCLHQWLETRPTRQVCPVCKAAISKDKVIPLYGRGSAKQDPRDKLPPRPPGQRTEPENNAGMLRNELWEHLDSLALNTRIQAIETLLNSTRAKLDEMETRVEMLATTVNSLTRKKCKNNFSREESIDKTEPVSVQSNTLASNKKRKRSEIRTRPTDKRRCERLVCELPPPCVPSASVSVPSVGMSSADEISIDNTVVHTPDTLSSPAVSDVLDYLLPVPSV